MTPNETIILKEQIKKIIVDHLTPLGYPNMNKQQILDQLPKMWIKIEEAKLNKEGLKYVAFVQHAHSQALMSEIMGKFR